MEKEKGDTLYYCFRYKCKLCPIKMKCDKEIKDNKQPYKIGGDTIERRRKPNTNERENKGRTKGNS